MHVNNLSYPHNTILQCNIVKYIYSLYLLYKLLLQYGLRYGINQIYTYFVNYNTYWYNNER